MNTRYPLSYDAARFAGKGRSLFLFFLLTVTGASAQVDCQVAPPTIVSDRDSTELERPVEFIASGCDGLILWYDGLPGSNSRPIEFGGKLVYFLRDKQATIYASCTVGPCTSGHATKTIVLLTQKPPGNTTRASAPTDWRNELRATIPPSPNAASLGQYGDIPVSNYSGLPGTSIPLYTVQDRNLNLPISLSYHHSGIRVEQEASNVGLGWALNAGGVIARTVRRMDDLNPTYGYAFHPVPAETAINSTFIQSFCTEASGSNFNLDSEPDIFTYNVGGLSGKFILQANNPQSFPIKGIMLDQSDVQVSVNQLTTGTYPAYEWKLVAPDGTIYLFTAQEKSQSVGTGGDGSSPPGVLWPQYYDFNNVPPADMGYGFDYSSGQGITSWYLTKVKSAVNDAEITLGYDNANLYYSASMVSASQTAVQASVALCGPEGIYSGNYLSYGATVSSQVYLNSIDFPNGRVLFTYADREDLAFFNASSDPYPLSAGNTGSIETRINNQGGSSLPRKKPQRLTNVRIVDGSGSSLYQWDFYQSYFNQDQVSALPPNPTQSQKIDRYKNLRLRLDSLVQSNAATVLPGYRFAYHGDVVSGNQVTTPVTLPTKTSQAKDYFGYHNGKTGNDSPNITSIIPNLYYPKVTWGATTSGAFVPTFLGYGKTTAGVDREVDAEQVKFGSLSVITYPTGGQTNFFYETHKALSGAGEVRVLEYGVKNNEEVNFEVPLINNGYSQFFQATVTSKLTCRLYQTCNTAPGGGITITDYGTGCTDVPGAYNGTVFAKLTGPSSSILASQTYGLWANKICLPARSNLTTCNNFDGNYSCQATAVNNVPLNPGTNKLSSFRLPVSNAVDYPTPSVDLLAYAYMNQDYEVRDISGLRIARIEHSTPEGTLQTKTYSYQEGDLLGAGKLLKPIEKYKTAYEGYLRKQYIQTPSVFSCSSTNLNTARWQCEVASGTVNPVGSEYSGQVVGYSQVTVAETGNGKTVYTYHNQKDVRPTNELFANTPSLPFLSNGLPIAEAIYDATGSLVKKTEYEHGNRTASNQRIGGFKYINCAGTPTNMYYSYYQLPSEFWYNSKVVTRLYGNPSNTITEQRFKYNSATYTQVSEAWQSAPDSVNTWVRDIFRYPYDYSTPEMVSLRNLNRVGEMIASDREVFRLDPSNGGTSSVQPLFSQRKSYGVSGTFYLPNKLEQKTEGGPWRTRMDNFVYNPNGNLTSYRTTDGKTTYLNYHTATGKKNLISQTESDNGNNNAVLKATTRQLLDYQPLKGVSKLTAPNLLARNFSYDELGRLVQVRDNSSFLEELYSYSYRRSLGCTPPSAPVVTVSGATTCNVTLSASGCSGTVTWSHGPFGASTTVPTTQSTVYSATCRVNGCTGPASAPVTVPQLPAGWFATDIGVPVAGCTELVNGQLTSVGNGYNYSSTDANHFTGLLYNGANVTIIAKISAKGPEDGNRSGIMLRSGLADDARYYTLVQDGNNGAATVGELKRDITGGAGTLFSYHPSPLNATWIKVVKTGGSIKGYYSSDPNPEANNAWNGNFALTGTSPVSLDLGNSFYLGLVTWGVNNQTTFSSITVNGTPL